MSSSDSTEHASTAVQSQLALRFISGKYQGGEVPLQEGQEIFVGRSSELDMVLVEEMVSRKHARIELKAGHVFVEDLGSTNGTFVNGERVEQASLNEGDRLLIGTSILKLVTLEDTGPSSRRNIQKVAHGRDTIRSSVAAHSTRMSGNLQEIPLPDLMQLFGTSKKSGTLLVMGEQDGRFHLREGLIINASLDGYPSIGPEKAAYRMLAWAQGTFSLEPEESGTTAELSLTPQAFLMEGFRQQDELKVLLENGPAPTARFALRSPLKAPLEQLKSEQLEVLQLLLEVGALAAAEEKSSLSELEFRRHVRFLVEEGYLEIVSEL